MCALAPERAHMLFWARMAAIHRLPYSVKT
jgi:hypothetical protein